MTYSLTTRVSVYSVFCWTNGQIRETSRRTGVSHTTIRRWRASEWWNELSKNTHIRHKGRDNRIRNATPRKRTRTKLTENAIQSIKNYYLTVNKYAFQKEVRQHLLSININISLSSVCRGVAKAQLKRKRTASRLLGTPSNDQILEFYNRIKACKRSLILSIDEMYASEKVVPTHAYVLDGQEQVDSLIAYKKGGWIQRTLIQCAASDGSMHHKIKQGGANRECFEKYIYDLPYPSGTVILLDNSPTHKKLEATFAKKGYDVIFLPPYCPMFQPVESVFSKVKREFRSRYPWTIGVENALEECVKNVNSSDVKGFFRLSSRKLDQKVAAITGIVGL